jgi:type IX secretion system PorP/SprF family membrane protein
MIRKQILSRVSLLLALCAGTTQAVQAQDVHFTQFEASPLILNPSFTGGFNGQYRAAAVYRNQWSSVTIPFVTYGASFDLPIVTDLSTDDYLAIGGQIYNDKAGDGNLVNFSGLLSVAYGKYLGAKADKLISLGVQGGYSEKSLDMSKLYFGDEFLNGTFEPGTSAEHPYFNNKTKYFTVNAGLSFQYRISDNFGFVLGGGANNLNQPKESLMKKANSTVGLAMRYNGQLGVIAYLSDKFSIRPAALYQSQASATEFIAGNEFNYILGVPDVRSYATSIFLSGWYRSSDAIMATIGMEFKGVRFGVSYDYNISSLKSASNGNGGFEISLRYIAPNLLDFAHKKAQPCARF